MSLRIPDKNNREELDQQHLEICEKVDALETEINSLKNQKGSWEGLQKSLALLRGSRNKLEKNESLEEQITEIEDRLSKTKEPHTCDKEIQEKKDLIEQLRIEYIQIPFFLPAEHFETKKQWVSIKTGSIIKRNEDPKNKTYYLYESSQYASPSTKILFNDDGTPKEIIKYIRNSATYGQLVTLHTPILIDIPQPPKKKNKPYKAPVFNNWNCPRCHAEVNENLLVCFKCGCPKPIEKKEPEKKKGLRDKLKRGKK